VWVNGSDEVTDSHLLLVAAGGFGGGGGMIRYILGKSYVVFDATEAASGHGSNGSADVGAVRVVTGSKGGARLSYVAPVVMMLWNSKLCVRS
jgi:hypothetical protein